jgi:cell division control protein 45
VAQKFNLEDIVYQTFVKQIDGKTQFTATDFILSLSSILESYNVMEVDNEEVPLLNDKTMMEANFYKAMDLAETKDSKLLIEGADIARMIQESIVTLGSSLIERREIKNASSFRYCVLENQTESNQKLFSNPLAMQKLGIFIIDVYAEMYTNSCEKPLLMCVHNKEKETYYIVGIQGSSRS